MAVSKKKTFPSKRNIRRKCWEKKIFKQTLFALSKDNSKSFVFPFSMSYSVKIYDTSIGCF